MASSDDHIRSASRMRRPDPLGTHLSVLASCVLLGVAEGFLLATSDWALDSGQSCPCVQIGHGGQIRVALASSPLSRTTRTHSSHWFSLVPSGSQWDRDPDRTEVACPSIHSELTSLTSLPLSSTPCTGFLRIILQTNHLYSSLVLELASGGNPA